MKEKVIKELLELHCNGCSGKAFNCQGCNREETIREIVNKSEEKPKKTTKK